MPINAQIGPAFWADDDVARLTTEQKLAWIYILTSGQISNIGVFTTKRRRFEFDTGLDWDTLRSTFEALPRGLKGLEGASTPLEGDEIHLLVLNWVKHSIFQGADPKTIKNDNRIRNLGRLFGQLTPKWQSLFASHYPALVASFGNSASSHSKNEGASSPLEGRISDQIRSESYLSDKEGGVGETTIEGQIREFSKNWGGDVERNLPGPIPAALADRYLDWHREKGRAIPAGWEDELVAWWAKEVAGGREQHRVEQRRVGGDVEAERRREAVVGALEPRHLRADDDALRQELALLDLADPAQGQLAENLRDELYRRDRRRSKERATAEVFA